MEIIVAIELILCYILGVIAKIRRFSRGQLLVLACLLKDSEKVVSVSEIERKVGIAGKKLGGVLSSLARTQFRGEYLIEPMGRASDSKGLRWQFNKRAVNKEAATFEVDRILESFI